MANIISKQIEFSNDEDNQLIISGEELGVITDNVKINEMCKMLFLREGVVINTDKESSPALKNLKDYRDHIMSGDVCWEDVAAPFHSIMFKEEDKELLVTINSCDDWNHMGFDINTARDPSDVIITLLATVTNSNSGEFEDARLEIGGKSINHIFRTGNVPKMLGNKYQLALKNELINVVNYCMILSSNLVKIYNDGEKFTPLSSCGITQGKLRPVYNLLPM